MTQHFRLTLLTKRCKSCGRKLADHATFCDRCGVSSEIDQGYPVSRRYFSAEDMNFIVNFAVTLFAVSLGFSIDFANRDWDFFPTVCLYRGVNDSTCVASLVLVVGFILCLLPLGLFWYYRERIYGRPKNMRALFGYLIFGAIIGILPWIAYLVTLWVT